MAQPTHINSPFNAFVDLSLKQEMTTEVFAKKISEIQANQIELIAMDLISRIPPYLGPVVKAKIDQKVIQPKDFNTFGLRECMMLIGQKSTFEQVVEQKNPEFFSDKEFGEFTAFMLWPIKAYIEEAFSTPFGFLEHGMSIQLSDYDPDEILSDVCEKMGIKITATDVPRKYQIRLNLNTELSQKQSTLVFVFSQRSNGIEFSKHTFTIENLEKLNGDNLNGLI